MLTVARCIQGNPYQRWLQGWGMMLTRRDYPAEFHTNPMMSLSWTKLLCQLLVFLLLLQKTCSQVSLYGTQLANKCFSVAGVPRLDFNICAEEEMILVTNAIQGIGQQYQQCMYRHGDCIEPTTPDTDNKLREQCVGMASCSITVSVAWMPKCSAYSSYNYIMYRCIPKSEVMNICSLSSTETSRQAFLSSPGYPHKYPADINCQCNITTDPGQRILLLFADYVLEWSEKCENDVILVSDGDSRMPRCGQLPRNYNITSQTNKIEVYFRTDEWQEFKGFWIQVEALGMLKVACGPVKRKEFPTTTTSTTTKPSSPATTLTTMDATSETEYIDAYVETETGNNYQTLPDGSTIDYYYQDTDDPRSKKDAYLAGIIVGCTILFIVIVLLIIFIIWFKKRRHKEDISPGTEQTYRPKPSDD